DRDDQHRARDAQRLARGPHRGGDVPPGRAAPSQHCTGDRARRAPEFVDPPTAPRSLVISDLARLGWTFLWLSLICIGGGAGVVPAMPRQVVDRTHWVSAREFLDGYALSQLTPGPSMLVAVFVGYRAHGVVGALLAGTAMFLPTALLTAVVARQWASLRHRPWAAAIQ